MEQPLVQRFDGTVQSSSKLCCPLWDQCAAIKRARTRSPWPLASVISVDCMMLMLYDRRFHDGTCESSRCSQLLVQINNCPVQPDNRMNTSKYVQPVSHGECGKFPRYSICIRVLKLPPCSAMNATSFVSLSLSLSLSSMHVTKAEQARLVCQFLTISV